ncbi:MAG: DUF4179 domain-containing protein [Syntrophomonadaceae bacterium]|nr:DUF4179 domain-containing protein [Syntrophomonadaceae bacterium]
MNSLNRVNLQNIKSIFEKKTGVDLDARHPRYQARRMDEVCRRKGSVKGKIPLRQMLTSKGVAVFLAVVLTLCTAGVAFAVVTNWFSTYFTNNSGEALTPEQYRFIEEKSVGIGQSVTVDGYTVTVNSAICDAQTLYLAVSVKGPEGIRIDMDSEEGSLFFEYVKSESTGTYTSTGHLISWNRGITILDDGDGKENTVTMVIQEQYVMSADSNRVYTDGEIWKLQLADLSMWSGAPLYDEVTTLTEGGWSFEFPLTEMSGEVEMISSPVVCVAQAGGETGPKESVEMMVDSLVLRPFSVTLRYSFIPGNRPEAVDILDVYLVMKDGSTVTARPRSGGGAGGIGSTGGTMSYVFDTPVMLDEVAYVVLPKDVQVPFPEE